VRVVVTIWLAVGLSIVAAGAWLTWGAVVGRSDDYARLRKVGVPVTGQIESCTEPAVSLTSPVRTKPRCTVSVRFGGVTRTWQYPGSATQFETREPGGGVAMILDPDHPATAYTVHDVKQGSGSGWGGTAYLGLVLAAFGVVLLVAPVLL
jgi:hypothetical protein